MSSPQVSFVGFYWFAFFLYSNFCSAHRDKEQSGVEAELMGRVDVWYVGALWLDTQDSKQKQAEKRLIHHYATMQENIHT